MTVYSLNLKVSMNTETITDAMDIITMLLEDQGIKIKNIQINGNDESLSQKGGEQ